MNPLNLKPGLFFRSIDETIIITRRLVKGILLAFWIGILVYLAFSAASRQGTQIIESVFTDDSYTVALKFGGAWEDVLSPIQHLEIFLRRFPENPPPIDSVLDAVIKNPSWGDRKLNLPFDPNVMKIQQVNKREHEQYILLFTKAYNQLRMIVDDRAINIRDATIDKSIMPAAFDIEVDPKDSLVYLPKAAAAWIERERQRIDSEKAQNDLMNTFLLLIVLGAFGSLIFLTRDYITKEQDTPLEAYIFRPILGMFLAMAMFVIDILAHTLVSTANMTEIRHEPLYLLALAAGLLSEQAYEIVELRAQKALQRYRGEKPPGGQPTAGQPPAGQVPTGQA